MGCLGWGDCRNAKRGGSFDGWSITLNGDGGMVGSMEEWCGGNGRELRGVRYKAILLFAFKYLELQHS